MSVLDLLPKEFITKTGVTTLDEVKKNKLFAIYFSAHWCPPCRGFTPKLAEFYNDVNKSEKKIEIIFASCDQDQNSFNEYYGTMPWIAIPFGSESKDVLDDAFQVQGIPTLIVFDQTGKVKDKDGRMTVVTQGAAALAKWLA